MLPRFLAFAFGLLALIVLAISFCSSSAAARLNHRDLIAPTNVRKVALWLGHADIHTTEIYLRRG